MGFVVFVLSKTKRVSGGRRLVGEEGGGASSAGRHMPADLKGKEINENMDPNRQLHSCTPHTACIQSAHHTHSPHTVCTPHTQPAYNMYTTHSLHTACTPHSQHTTHSLYTTHTPGRVTRGAEHLNTPPELRVRGPLRVCV